MLIFLFFISFSSATKCPTGMVPLPKNKDGGICIDQYEQSVEYFQDNEWKTHPFNYNLDDLISQGIPIKAVDSRGNFPQAYINQEQSKLACNATKKHLCKYYEWMAGCQGVHNYTYPYGNDYIKGACNEGEENPVIRIYGPHPKWTYAEMNDPRLDTLDRTLRKGGSFPQCCGDSGSCDQAGNLDEWIDMITPEGHAVFKGGYFVDDIINGPGCLYLTRAHASTYHDYSLGFRCCI